MTTINITGRVTNLQYGDQNKPRAIVSCGDLGKVYLELSAEKGLERTIRLGQEVNVTIEIKQPGR